MRYGIPREENLARDWMRNFSTLLSSDPGRFGINSIDAATIAAAFQSFDLDYIRATNQETRTSGSIVAKDESRAEAEQVCNFWAQTIKLNLGVSTEDKRLLGIHIDSGTRTPIEAPSSWPLLSILASTPGAQTLRYADSTTPSSRAKPFGVVNLQLFRVVAETAVESMEGAEFVGNYTKNPVGVAFDDDDNKKVATYFARWATRNEVGPFGNPVSMTIAA